MREEYSESNNRRMIEIALLLHANHNLTAGSKIDLEDEPSILKDSDAVVGCNFESNSVGLKPGYHRLNQILDSKNMEYSGPSDMRKGVPRDRKFRLKNGIDGNSAGIIFQW